MTGSTFSSTGQGAGGVSGQAGARSGRLIGGLVLVMLGAISFAGQFTRDSSLGLLVLPAMAIVFLGWGIAIRHAGPIIAGCILGGIGLGVILQTNVALPRGDANGAVILLGMALGFAAITPLTAIFAGCRQWWGLIVGAILALVGVALLIGGQALQVLELAGNAWPLVLVSLGIYMMVQRGGDKR